MKKTPTRAPASPRKKAALKKKAAPKKPPTSQKPGPRTKTTGKRSPAPGNREATMADLVTKALEDLKAKHIVRLDVRALTDVMDLMIIASGTSNRHVKSLADHARMEMKKAGYLHYGLEGEDAGEWVLVDFGGVVLHVMQPHVREFYDLERLWSTPQVPSADA